MRGGELMEGIEEKPEFKDLGKEPSKQDQDRCPDCGEPYVYFGTRKVCLNCDC